eukprot:503010-Rhodomonas_salina.1
MPAHAIQRQPRETVSARTLTREAPAAGPDRAAPRHEEPRVCAVGSDGWARSRGPRSDREWPPRRPDSASAAPRSAPALPPAPACQRT